MNFADLDLIPELLKAIEESGYTTPTPIQEQAIPKILEGLDLRASAQTGTGKTAAFILPTLNRLMKSPSKKRGGPRVLILVPTRELAMQVSVEATKYAKHLPNVRTACVYGGVPYPVQKKELSRPYEILVATPGRLIDHLERGRIDLSLIEVLILDEADRMLDMGFIEPVEHIAAATPASRQTLLFSATLKGSVLRLSKNLLKDPVEVSISLEDAKQTNTIEQRLFTVDNLTHKHQILDHLLKDPTMKQAIVFTSTKSYANELVDQLIDQGHDAAALHGDMNQRQRTHTIKLLRLGKIRILVATDVAARGIDVQTISHVINFDLPNSAEDYVHRIGRTGRAGHNGLALSFTTYKDMRVVKDIERFTGQKLTLQVIPGMEPQSRSFSSSGGPSSKRGNSTSRNGNYNRGSRSSESSRGSRNSDFGRNNRNSDSGRSSRNSDSDSKTSEFSRSPRNSDSDSKNSEFSRSSRNSDSDRGSKDFAKTGKPFDFGRGNRTADFDKGSKNTDFSYKKRTGPKTANSSKPSSFRDKKYSGKPNRVFK